MTDQKWPDSVVLWQDDDGERAWTSDEGGEPCTDQRWSPTYVRVDRLEKQRDD